MGQSTLITWLDRLSSGETGHGGDADIKLDGSESFVSPSFPAPVFRGRYAVSLLEFMAKMALIQKANPIHDFFHAEKSSAQQPFRLT